ncbi:MULTISPECIES: hypothetical protein [Sphingobacterium]|uniref:hypothetical protein n=1 Tax=Sphingobacterium TaxID=28453 RepID=UPI001918F32C|nr:MULTISPECIES: hypothetical protein [Sphingobacterium]QQT29939.1 hypothetical protein I6I99_21810 [Sphingobacterium multivorum]
MAENQQYIDRCKLLIEEKLGWENSSSWQSQDFENLSEQIFVETNTIISSSTLKRIWGKVQYKSRPNISTLDALSRFIGYSNWRDFVKSLPRIDNPETLTSRPKKSIDYYRLFIIFGIVFFAVSFLLQMRSNKTLSFSNVKFQSEAVTDGVPNTVIFKYDASQSNADSVFIQQNWDDMRRKRVEKFHHEHASVYYLPGYYRAKLVLNDSIVKEHDVFIESEKWMGVLLRDSIPFYFPEEIYRHDNWLGITPEDLGRDLNIYNQEVHSFMLTHVNKELSVDSRSFSLSLNVQNTYDYPGAPCRQTEIVLLGTEGVIIIPLSSRGCIGDIKLRIGNLFMDGRSNDLSAFGVDFSSPVAVECSASSEKIKIKLNNELAYEGSFSNGIGNIVGIRIKFQGSGRLDSFKLGKVS